MGIISASVLLMGLLASSAASAQVYVDGSGNVSMPGVSIQGGNVQVPGVSIQGGNVQVQGAHVQQQKPRPNLPPQANINARGVHTQNGQLNVDGNQYGNPHAKEQLERLRQINGGGNAAVITPDAVLTPGSVHVPGVNVRY